MSRLQLPAKARSTLRGCLAAIDAGDRRTAVDSARALAGDSDWVSRFAGVRLLYQLRLYQEALDALDPNDGHALRLRFSLLKRLRFEEEAGSSLRELLRSADDLRLHEAAVLHYQAMGRPALALKHLDFILRRKSDGGHRHRAQLRLAVDAQDLATVRRAAEQALQLEPERWLDVTDKLMEVGLFDLVEAEARKRSETADGRAVLAELALFRGDAAAAYELAANARAAHPTSRRAITVMVGASVLAGERDRADAALAAWQGELTPALRTWLGELLLHRNDLKKAQHELSRVQNDVGDYFAAKLLSVLVKGRLDREEYVTKTAYDGLLEGQIQALGLDLRFADKLVEANELRIVVAEALRQLAGNRTPYPTTMRDGTLQRVRIPPSPRHRVAEVQHSIRWVGLARARDAMVAELAAIGPHPIAECYDAEMDLWAGDYESARGKFENILRAARQTTWGWIGLGASHVLLGDPAEGLRVLDEGVQVMGWRGATLPVYRGEALFRLGSLDEAAQELSEACRTHPGRVAAWLLRVLAEDARGNASERDAVFAHLDRTAPALLSDAARAAGIDGWWPGRPDLNSQRRVAEQALVLMRGNRSSSCPFWFAPETDTVRSVLMQRPATTPDWEARERRDLLAMTS